MKKSKKRTAVFLSALVAATAMPFPVLAAEAGTPKEEVVYIHLDAAGMVEDIHVVNILDGNTQGTKIDQDIKTDQGTKMNQGTKTDQGTMTDYGNYVKVRNMTTTDAVDYSGDTVKIRSSAPKLYYEGELESTVIPWEIQIRYFLDGKAYDADEIAGKSGELNMTVHIAENQECRGGFYEHYALQASVLLDTDICKNITAPDATIANVGSKKQLTYTILPGKGADLEITAQVSSFEMDGISVNGIPLNLNLEVDDQAWLEQVTELSDAVGQLDDGAAKLQDGVSDLQDGAQSGLKSGVHDLQDGAKQLHSGAADLKDGGSSLQDGAADLQAGVNALDEGIYDLNNGIGQMQEALHTLNQQSPQLVNGSASFQAALFQLQEALGGVSLEAEELRVLTDASSAVKSGIDSLVNGITELQSQVNYEAYKGAMAQNGLDIDGLRQKNQSAISGLEGLLADLSAQMEELKHAGVDTAKAESQVSQLSDLIALLGANNAGIDGTESYLQAAGAGLSSLLQGAKALQESYAAFDGKIGELVHQLGGLAYRMSELSSAIHTLVSEYGKLDQGINGYTAAVAKIATSYSQITDGAARLVTGSSALKTGSESLYSGTGELVLGIAELYDGTGTLSDGAGALDEGAAELLSGIAQLYDGASELKDGTGTMREETKDMDTEIADQIDELIRSMTGGDFEPASFVSEKNTNVQSVQFVMQAGGVQLEEASGVTREEPKKLSVWQKFLNLFA